MQWVGLAGVQVPNFKVLYGKFDTYYKPDEGDMFVMETEVPLPDMASMSVTATSEMAKKKARAGARVDKINASELATLQSSAAVDVESTGHSRVTTSQPAPPTGAMLTPTTRRVTSASSCRKISATFSTAVPTRPRRINED